MSPCHLACFIPCLSIKSTCYFILKHTIVLSTFHFYEVFMLFYILQEMYQQVPEEYDLEYNQRIEDLRKILTNYLEDEEDLMHY